MTRDIRIRGTAYPVRLAGWSFVEAARNGEVGMGGMDAPAEAGSFDLSNHWDVTVTDSAATHAVYKGYLGDEDLSRGGLAPVGSNREFALDLVDQNTLLGDRVIRATGNRGAETAGARLYWLVHTAYLGGMAYHIPASDFTNMDAQDYTGQTPRDVLNDIAEITGWTFYVFRPNGVTTLYCDVWDSGIYVSASHITSDSADLDLVAAGSNYWAPVLPSLHGQRLGGRIYSGILYRYGSGSSVWVTDGSIASNYRSRETSVFDSRVKSAAAATAKGNQFLTAASSPELVIPLELEMPAEHVNDFQAGYTVGAKLPHLGIATNTDFLIVRRDLRPAGSDKPSPTRYKVSLELSQPKSTNWNGGGTPPPPGSGGGPTITGSGGSITLTKREVRRQLDRNGFYTEQQGTTADERVGSWVYDNTPYTIATNCPPLGAGSFSGWVDTAQWWSYTAPSDTNGLGLLFRLDCSALFTTGVVYGYEIAHYPSSVGDGRFEFGSPLTDGPLSGESHIYVPRNLINWGGTNSIILRPSWHCARGAYFCDPALNFSQPVDDGRGSSGRYDGFVVDTLKPAVFSGTGMAPGVAALGAVDGVNRIFTLINWTGLFDVQLTVNGMVWDQVGWTFDRVALTITLASAPPSGSVVLFIYDVQ